jgi:hypothetical protein
MVSHGAKIVVALVAINLGLLGLFFGYVSLDSPLWDDNINSEQLGEPKEKVVQQRDTYDCLKQRRHSLHAELLKMRSAALCNSMCNNKVNKYKQMLEDVQLWCNPSCQDELSECKRLADDLRSNQYSDPGIGSTLLVLERPRHLSYYP